MNVKTTFKRYELKYLITKEQKDLLMDLFSKNMEADSFGKSTIYNLYYDTSDFLHIRRSIEKPVYKEKLRVRSYGRATEHSKVYLELKKKYKSVVYKRRIGLTENSVIEYFNNVSSLPETQIAREIDYVKSFYVNLGPRVFIAYDREAYFGKEDGNFRVTFDTNIVYRQDDLHLSSEKYGEDIIEKNQILMEIKVAGGIPLWLVHFLSENKIYKTSFSKYGIAYKKIFENHKQSARAA